MSARRSPAPERWRRVAGVLGRLLVYAGLVAAATVAYLVFATAGIADQAQRQLRSDFATLARQSVSPSTAPRSATDPTRPSGSDGGDATGSLVPAGSGPAPTIGSPLARLRIPTLGMDLIVVEGVGTEPLRGGPGHYPGTSRPGERGNVAIAGHRTTYGAPFGDLDRLRPTDRILLDTIDGRSLAYEVTGTEIVAPSDIRVLDDVGDDRLTLTSCHPKRSARRRIVVSARLVGRPAPDAAEADRPTTTTVPTTAVAATGAPAPAPATGLAGEPGPAGSVSAGRGSIGPWWAWLALGAVANEGRHRCRWWFRGRARVWSVAGSVVFTGVVLAAAWLGIAGGADLIGWNL